MSGIYGLFYRDGTTVTHPAMRAMQDAMQEWGTDDHGVWIEKNLGLGAVLMHDTPESVYERQPAQSRQTDRYVLCADARIDNREELCELLGIPAAEQPELSDSALFLEAFLKWGENCTTYVVGAYALAVWDRPQQKLFIVRDHMGFRPLYYYEDDKKFVFASDVRAIRAVPGVPSELDPTTVIAARSQYTPYLRERSLYRNIHKLRPAGLLIVTRERRHKGVYWHPEKVNRVRYQSNEDYAQAMAELVHQAVKSSLRTRHPIGSHLSGGLDSSTVTMIASRQLRERGEKLADTFTWSPPPCAEDYPLTDERALIELVCEIEGLSCTYSSLSVDDAIGVWKSDMRNKPQDVILSEVAVRRDAAEQGIRTMLSGWGGDEFATFNGRGFFSEQLLKIKWWNLLSEMKLRRARTGVSYGALLAYYTLLPLLPASLYARRRSLMPSTMLKDPGVSEASKRFQKMLFVKSRSRATMRQNQLNFLELGWLTYRIESWAARSLEVQLEYRFPLLDRRLLDFCLGLPAEQFVQNGWNRFIFRNAAADVLPPAICWHANNKAEPSSLEARKKNVDEASSQFEQMCSSGTIDAELVSSMWRDKLLSPISSTQS